MQSLSRARRHHHEPTRKGLFSQWFGERLGQGHVERRLREFCTIRGGGDKSNFGGDE